MQGDPTAIMLDQLMRVVVMGIIQTTISAAIYGAAAYLVLKLARK